MKRDPKYRFLINDNPTRREVHDLYNEKTGSQQCQIDEIQNFRHLLSTSFDDLVIWLTKNPSYDGCAYCLPKFNRG